MSETLDRQDATQLREAVRQRYATAAQLTLAGEPGSCCGPSGCCADTSADPITADLYDADAAPSETALGASLGCGNPTVLIDLAPGQDVLDLGSGGGLDVLLSARRVAPDGTAYGVDMTEEMLRLAERNRAEAGIENARFLRGTIEDLPLPDDSVDVVISNCVINLSTDKDRVLAEAFRVLRPGGRFAVADIVLLRDLEPRLMTVVELWTGCISGALTTEDYQAKLRNAGFDNATVQLTREYTDEDLHDLAGTVEDALPDSLTVADAVTGLAGAFASAFIRADKAE
ncbi:arsenite methyltransferase [Micropruina sp.]|uniref:arsenite methyltransferase n=1 Tax=Micropruina sp. TaxID=2737536 RepID=UPI0039E3C4B6